MRLTFTVRKEWGSNLSIIDNFYSLILADNIDIYLPFIII